jgi:hypothetical protein
MYSALLPASQQAVHATQMGPIGMSQALFCDEIDHCITLTQNGVVYLEHAGNSIVAGVRMFGKDGTGPQDLGNTGSAAPLGAVPVGLDSDATRVVSSFAMSATGNGSSFPVPAGCWIFETVVGSPSSTMLVFHSTTFSCMDARIDGDDVYFAIIGSDHCNNCGGEYPLHGLGIGRISLVDHSNFESISVGVNGIGAGPRHVRIDNDYIFAIDPAVIARIDKSELDGKHDYQQ